MTVAPTLEIHITINASELPAGYPLQEALSIGVAELVDPDDSEANTKDVEVSWPIAEKSLPFQRWMTLYAAPLLAGGIMRVTVESPHARAGFYQHKGYDPIAFVNIDTDAVSGSTGRKLASIRDLLKEQD